MRTVNSSIKIDKIDKIDKTEAARRYLAVISHTHWDREWHLPFQTFRLKLADLVDRLLDLLESNPDYRYFMLDGQTVVLEDYLELRPRCRERLRKHISSGRILVGPWYILPDEFLVGGESIIRNLLTGHRVAREFGSTMKVGYLPDCFGHIAEIPQVLRGFDIDSAVVWRGVGDDVKTTEFLWQSPDGSEVSALHLADGYFNAHRLPEDLPQFLSRIGVIRNQLEPKATTPYLLLMNGSDHAFPEGTVPVFLAEANEILPDVELVHTNLPELIEAIKDAKREGDIDWQVVAGELRDSRQAPLLPGVLSTRMWIKQRNFECESLLEKWAEPFTAWSTLINRNGKEIDLSGNGKVKLDCQGEVLSEGYRAKMALRQAWRYLLQNHPHDSICGCSVDQVHEEMRGRFDWSEQIADSLVDDSLKHIVASIDTHAMWPEQNSSGDGFLPRTEEPSHDPAPDRTSIVVFNPVNGPRSDFVSAWVPVPPRRWFRLVDDAGSEQPFQVLSRRPAPLISADATRDNLLALFNGTGYPDRDEWTDKKLRFLEKSLLSIGGEDAAKLVIADMTVRSAARPGWAVVDIDALDIGERKVCQIRQAMADLATLVREREDIALFQFYFKRSDELELGFVAESVPGFGYRTFRMVSSSKPTEEKLAQRNNRIENEYLVVEVDAENGTLTVTDKDTGEVFRGLNHFVDGGDCGDEYNYAAPVWDSLVDAPSAPPTVELTEAGPARFTLKIGLVYDLPKELTRTRRSRLYEKVRTPLTSFVSLLAGVKRVDVRTIVENQVKDHRLRVHFPAEMAVEESYAESHFGVIKRSVSVPQSEPDWAEDAVGTYPQKRFVDINDGVKGLTIANRGLPEYEVLRNGGESAIALTLLRSVGWLSRDDLKSRRGHAGPAIETLGAQNIGSHVFEYAIIPHASTWHLSFEQARCFSHPMRAMTTDNHWGTLPTVSAFMEVSPLNLVVSAIKLPEEGDGLTVRLYNIDSNPISGFVRLRWPCERAELVNLKEERIEDLPVQGDRIALGLGPRQMATVRFYF